MAKFIRISESPPGLAEKPEKNVFWASGISIFIHAVIFIVVIFGIKHYSKIQETEITSKLKFPEAIIWIKNEGPGGGGGGGGNKMKEPPRKAELPGKEKLTVPAEKPKPISLKPEQKPADLTPQIPLLDISALKTGAGEELKPGAIEGVPGGTSQGPGTGGGAGTGTGTGIGPGTGSGLGPGSGGGFGGGAYRPGNGIENPKPIREVKPAYTAEAMRTKIQGTVIIECVVLADGTVGEARVIKSLDRNFGLDDEALKAAKKWLFVPAKLKGLPVPILINIELSFTLR